MRLKNLITLGLIMTWAGSSNAAEQKAAAAQPGAVVAGEKVTLARYAKALVGPGNITVEIASYKKEDKSEGALLLFKGVEGDWDGKALNFSIEPSGNEGFDYVTQYGGKERHSLVVRKQYGQTTHTLYLPGSAEGIPLTPSDGAAQLTTPQAILKDFQNQQAKK